MENKITISLNENQIFELENDLKIKFKEIYFLENRLYVKVLIQSKNKVSLKKNTLEEVFIFKYLMSHDGAKDCLEFDLEENLNYGFLFYMNQEIIDILESEFMDSLVETLESETLKQTQK